MLMRKKSIWLVISTLLLLLTVMLVSCISSADSNTDSPTTAFASSTSNSSRFSSEEVYISDLDDRRAFFIITDHQTGKQYLYIDSWSSVGVGAAMVELGSTGETLSNIDE